MKNIIAFKVTQNVRNENSDRNLFGGVKFGKI